MIKASEVLKEIKNVKDVESFVKDEYQVLDKKALELAKETVDILSTPYPIGVPKRPEND